MPPETKGKGLLGSLSPRQKRFAAIGGVAGVLALIYLLSRRSDAAQAPDATASPDAAAATGQDVGAAGASPYDFSSDNSAYLGQIGSQLEGQLSNIGAGLHSQIGMLRGQVKHLRHDLEKRPQHHPRPYRPGRPGPQRPEHHRRRPRRPQHPSHGSPTSHGKPH